MIPASARWDTPALAGRPLHGCGGTIAARELHDRRIANAMSRGPISVHADTPIEEAADLMHRHRIKRLPVVADGKVVGIISQANLVEGLFDLHKHGPRI